MYIFVAYFNSSGTKVNPKVRQESTKIALMIVFYSVFRMSKIGNVPKHEKEKSFARNWLQSAIRSIKTEVWRTRVRHTRRRARFRAKNALNAAGAGGHTWKPEKRSV